MKAEDQTPAARVLDVTVRIAEAAPARRGRYVGAAQIRWSLIEELRAALTDLGIEWTPDSMPR